MATSHQLREEPCSGSAHHHQGTQIHQSQHSHHPTCIPSLLQHHSRVCSMQIGNNTATTLTPTAEQIVRLFVRQVFRHILLCPSGTKCACQCIRTYFGLEQGKGGVLVAAQLNNSCVNLELEMENGVGPASKIKVLGTSDPQTLIPAQPNTLINSILSTAKHSAVQTCRCNRQAALTKFQSV